jgi:hypothetical protein
VERGGAGSNPATLADDTQQKSSLLPESIAAPFRLMLKRNGHLNSLDHHLRWRRLPPPCGGPRRAIRAATHAWRASLPPRHASAEQSIRLRIWGSEVRIFPGAPVISMAYWRAAVLISKLKRCLERQTFCPSPSGRALGAWRPEPRHRLGQTTAMICQRASARPGDDP